MLQHMHSHRTLPGKGMAQFSAKCSANATADSVEATQIMCSSIENKALKDAVESLELHRKANQDLYAQLLRSCGNAKSLSDGKRVHAHIAGSELHRKRYLLNLLVEMYGKCGNLEDACRVFDSIEKPNVFSWNIMLGAYARNRHLQEATNLFEKMPVRDAVSWNAMISGYAHNGQLQEARCIFNKMAHRDSVSWTIMIAGYAQNGHLVEARDMFEKMPQPSQVSWNALLTGYAQNGYLHEARMMFDRMPEKDDVSWNVMLTAYAQSGQLQEARKVFSAMPQRDPVAWTVMVSSCAQYGNLQEARGLFDKMPERDVVAWNAMVAAYCQYEDMQEARKLFDSMSQRDAASWNALISGYAQMGDLGEASSIFDKMHIRDQVSWNAIITAHAQMGHLEEARSLFDRMPNQNVLSWNALITGYAQNGYLEEAKLMFDKVPQKDVVSWNGMIAAYAQNGQPKEAIQLFREMDLEGTKANQITFASALDACAEISALAEGKIIHCNVIDSRFESDVVVGTALVNMYGKCGSLQAARSLFDRISPKDIFAWNAMVAIYAQSAHSTEVLELSKAMNLEGLQPDDITFVGIISSCSHAGLMKDGWRCFMSIKEDHGVSPKADHYVCLVDLLGRAGRLNEAEELINNMPFEPDAVFWATLVGACRLHNDVVRGARAAKHVVGLNPGDSAPYVLLSSMYAARRTRLRTVLS